MSNGFLINISKKETIVKGTSKEYTKQLSVLSEMLHWIVKFNHLFASGKAFFKAVNACSSKT